MKRKKINIALYDGYGKNEQIYAMLKIDEANYPYFDKMVTECQQIEDYTIDDFFAIVNKTGFCCSYEIIPIEADKYIYF